MFIGVSLSFNTLDVVSPGEGALPLLAAVAAAAAAPLLHVEAVDVQLQPRELRLIGGRHVVPALDRFIVAFRLLLEVILGNNNLIRRGYSNLDCHFSPPKSCIANNKLGASEQRIKITTSTLPSNLDTSLTRTADNEMLTVTFLKTRLFLGDLKLF